MEESSFTTAQCTTDISPAFADSSPKENGRICGTTEMDPQNDVMCSTHEEGWLTGNIIFITRYHIYTRY